MENSALFDSRSVYALVISVGVHPGSSVENLKPHEQAESFVHWLGSFEGGMVPSHNIHHLVNPSLAEVRQALKYLGVPGDSKIGEQLYFYFAGYGVGISLDEIGLVTAGQSSEAAGQDWADSLPEGARLKHFRDILGRSAAYSQVVFIMDYLSAAAPPRWEPLEISTTTASELVLVQDNAPPGAEPSPEHHYHGLLTQVVIDCLSGGPAGLDKRLTARDLLRAAQTGLASRAQGEGLELPAPLAFTSDQGMVVVENPENVPKGILTVELPKWVPNIQVVDILNRQVPHHSQLDVDPDNPKRSLFCAELLEGVFKVVATFGDRREVKLVSILPGSETRIRLDEWQQLAFKSVAPLYGGIDVYNTHAGNAIQYSREITWPDAPSGPSRLFLFLRSVNPKNTRAFAKGLSLFNENGDFLTDFSTEAVRNNRWGWMAFSADLEPGNYILRRGRSGVPVRYQSIYLCEGWETHACLVAEHNYPSLHNLSLAMFPLGTGFHPDLESTLISEVILRNLINGQGKADFSLVDKSREHLACDYTPRDLWLALLTAYAIRQYDFFDQLEYQEFLAELKEDLNSLVPDHPDVRALMLTPDQISAAPFWHPPALRLGLANVRQHATRHADTVPVGSLTDLVLDHFITGSPWTAWQKLTIAPRRAGDDDWQENKYLNWSAQQRESATGLFSPALLQQGSIADPVINLSSIIQQSQLMPASFRDQDPIVSSPIANLRNSQIAQQAIEIRKNAPNFADLPEKAPIEISISDRVRRMVEQITPEEISHQTGQPLSRVQAGLKNLGDFSALYDEDPGFENLPDVDSDWFNIAIQQSLTPAHASQDWEFGELPGEDEIPDSQIPGVTIEGLVFKITMEADRIDLRGRKKESAARAAEIASQLRTIASQLLVSAEYTVVTTLEGAMTYCNGAFLYLLQGVELSFEQTEGGQDEIFSNNLTAWERLLHDASLGKNTLSEMVVPPASAWVLHRMLIEDAGHTPAAYMNILRAVGVRSIQRSQREALSQEMDRLSRCSSRYAYGTATHEGSCLGEIKEHIWNMGSILGS